MDCKALGSDWCVPMESKQNADLKASEAAVASAWCGGMLRTPVTALMISSCTVQHLLSISFHRAKQSESRDPPLISLQNGGQLQ